MASKTYTAAASACLAGIACRYDGLSKPCEEIVELYQAGQLLLICPEQLGGLPTPRIPAGLEGGGGQDVLQGRARVVNRQGQDVTSCFVEGAQKALALVREAGLKKVYLKLHSPSCGLGSTGAAQGGRIKGDGVTAALFKDQGLEILPRG